VSERHLRSIFKNILWKVLDLPVVKEVQMEAQWSQCALICYCLSILFTGSVDEDEIHPCIDIFIHELHKELSKRRIAWKKCRSQRQQSLGLTAESLMTVVWTPRRLERWLALAEGDSKMEEFIFKGCEIVGVGVGEGSLDDCYA
jgi:hypothetical protein